MQAFNKIEQEAIVLSAICGLIDEMVNYNMFAEEWSPSWSNILFRSSTHARLFNILLVDFLSLPQKRKDGAPFDLKLPSETDQLSEKTYLFFLNKILEDPQLSTHNAGLRSVVEEFANWLAGDTLIENAWFPSLELEIDLKINRIEALKMTGDICKHNFTRLSARAKSLQNALSRNAEERSIDECYLALPEFQEWFHNHAFVYQSSQISEFLNRLRWAIHDYLKPEFQRAHRPYFDKYLDMQCTLMMCPMRSKTNFRMQSTGS